MCRVRVLQRGGECVVQSTTEYEEGLPKNRGPDGRVYEVHTTTCFRGQWGRDTSLKVGASTSVCGLTLTCVPEPVVLDAR